MIDKEKEKKNRVAITGTGGNAGSRVRHSAPPTSGAAGALSGVSNRSVCSRSCWALGQGAVYERQHLSLPFLTGNRQVIFGLVTASLCGPRAGVDDNRQAGVWRGALLDMTIPHPSRRCSATLWGRPPHFIILFNLKRLHIHNVHYSLIAAGQMFCTTDHASAGKQTAMDRIP